MAGDALFEAEAAEEAEGGGEAFLAVAAFVAGPDEGARLVTDAGATGLMVTDAADVVELAGLAAFRP